MKNTRKVSWSAKPENAWRKYIRPMIGTPGWVEDSSDISPEIKLSKRELLGLIILAQAIDDGRARWRVGYDPADGEQQNDGNLSHGSNRILVEHKLVAQQDTREPLEAIIGTYKKYERKGPQYGKDRLLIIHPNKQPEHSGMVRISALREYITNDALYEKSPFDLVILIALVAKNPDSWIFHLTQHYPTIKSPKQGGITQIDLDLRTGVGTVKSHGIDWGL